MPNGYNDLPSRHNYHEPFIKGDIKNVMSFLYLQFVTDYKKFVVDASYLKFSQLHFY